jgi:hypothetical protein
MCSVQQSEKPLVSTENSTRALDAFFLASAHVLIAHDLEAPRGVFEQFYKTRICTVSSDPFSTSESIPETIGHKAAAMLATDNSCGIALEGCITSARC